MSYEKRDNSGVLFKNDRKEKDIHPDYTGNAMIDGVEYWMSAWLKTGQKGKFMSFAFKPKEERKPLMARAQAAKPPDLVLTRPRNDLDDEIPF